MNNQKKTADKKTVSKIILSKQTLRNLSTSQLGVVAGGASKRCSSPGGNTCLPP